MEKVDEIRSTLMEDSDVIEALEDIRSVVNNIVDWINEREL